MAEGDVSAMRVYSVYVLINSGILIESFTTKTTRIMPVKATATSPCRNIKPSARDTNGLYKRIRTYTSK